MEQKTTSQQDNNAENIDLLLLAERSILFFRRYRWLFISAIILGLAVGYTFYKIIPKTYKSRLVLHSFVLTNSEQIQIAKGWNELLAKDESKSLAAEWNCNEKDLARVKWIHANEIQQVFSESNPNGFYIDALVTDTSILDELQEGIVYGFENNAYINERLTFRRSGLQQLIEKTRIEIRKLDSTKKQMEDIIGGTTHISTPLLIDASSVNRQLIDMNEKLLNLEENLKFTKSVQVLQSFSKIGKPDNPKLLPWLIMGLIGFLVLAYMIALLHSLNKGLRERASWRNK